MHPFSPMPRARLTCRTAFGVRDWLNLDFLTADGETVPLHVSLRAAEGAVVLNRFHAGLWGRELRWSCAARPAELALEFGRGRVVVAVDGRRLGSVDALPRPDRQGRMGLRRGFPGLGRIVTLRIAGALAPGSLRLWGQPRQAPGMALSERLDLVWTDPPDPAPAILLGEGLAPPEPAALIEGPEVGADGRLRRSLVAPLPGRAWAGGAERVRLGFAGGPEMVLTRAEVAARIEAAARAGLWLRDRTAGLQAVEVVRHARLMAALSPEAATALRGVAAGAGLEGWLAEGGEGAGIVLPAMGSEPVQARLDAARRATGRALRAGATALATAEAEAALADPALPPEGRRAVALGMVEGFVNAGEMAALGRVAAAAGVVPIPEGGGAWELSNAAAFDALGGRWTALAGRIEALTAGAAGWTVTPALGWAVARAAGTGAGAPAPAERARVVAAYLAHVERMAGEYQSRSPCLALIGAMVAILRRPEMLDPDALDWACWTARRVWGLSPRFWEVLGAEVPEGLVPSGRVAAALFAEATRETPDRGRLDELLGRAQALGMAEAVRFRRELLGPSGLPTGVPDPVAAAARGIDANEACFRALMHPDPAPAPPEAVAAAVAHLRRAWRGAPEGAQAALERRVVAGARALMKAPQVEALRDWALEARHLGGVGAALAQGLAAGLATAGHAGEAQALGARLAGPGREGSGARGLGALFDTLVCVYSCAANLETRLPELRATWLRDLEAEGIAWLVFIGGGDGTREGRIVRLDAPDDYEGLPAKTLAMLRWVHDHTGHARLLKVDDDCFVDVEAMFGDAALLRHPYVGRPLTRAPGQLDRTWHMGKSASDRGRLTPDKSPEPARYADGGTGYALSRAAVAALLEAADSPEGLRLRQVSVLEDKLVGDLLALTGIAVSGEDWRSSVWRRPGPGLAPVPAWEVGPLPFAGGPVRLVHLDDARAMATTAAAARAAAPRRGRIWPGFVPARCGSRTNALDLVSPPERLARARAARVAVVAAVRDEAAMLPLFLDHYRRLGVEGFLIADNASGDGTAAILAAAPDVAAFAVETPYAEAMFGVAWQQALVAAFRPGAWTVIADADEFLVLPEGPGDLPGLLAGPEMAGRDGVRVRMLDLYPKGPLSGVRLASGEPFAETGWADREPFLRETPVRGPFSDGETLTSALRHRLIPGRRSELFTAQKIAILRYRPWMRLTPGLHHVAEVRLAARELVFAHFKYTAAFRAKAEAEVRRKQHFNGAEEYRAYLALVSEGREVIWDPEVSVPWHQVLGY
jgi:hypothetical protein